MKYDQIVNFNGSECYEFKIEGIQKDDAQNAFTVNAKSNLKMDFGNDWKVIKMKSQV